MLAGLIFSPETSFLNKHSKQTLLANDGMCVSGAHDDDGSSSSPKNTPQTGYEIFSSPTPNTNRYRTRIALPSLCLMNMMPRLRCLVVFFSCTPPASKNNSCHKWVSVVSGAVSTVHQHRCTKSINHLQCKCHRALTQTGCDDFEMRFLDSIQRKDTLSNRSYLKQTRFHCFIK